MKIDFSAPILDLEDKPIVIGDKEQSLGGLVAEALMAPNEQGSKSGKDAAEAVELALMVKGKQPVDCTAEQIVKLQKSLDVIAFPLLKGRAYQMLNG